MEKPSCKFCGCENINCLARCSKTGFFFCNGKGDTYQSHILYHLQKSNSSEITLPEENKYHEIPLRCYICESTNIFNLGFISYNNNTSLYIVCNSKCIEELTQKEGMNPDSDFEPLVSDGYINSEVVNIPTAEEYEIIPFSQIITVYQESSENAISDKEETKKQVQEINSIKLQYQSRQEYVSDQTNFINIEQGEAKKYESSLQFQTIHLEWSNKFQCRFKSPPTLFQIVKSGTYLNFHQEGEEKGNQYIGYIIKKHKNFFIDTTFDSSQLHLINVKGNQKPVTVSLQFNQKPFERQKVALQKFLTYEKCMNSLIADIILGKTGEIIHHNCLKETVPFTNLNSPYFPSLSAAQINRLKTALSQRFSMILGPPGTGKTTMIAALCNSFVRAGIKPVLVCAQKDAAANVALLTIARTGLDVVRFVSSSVETFDSEVDKYITAQIALNHFKKSSDSSNVELLSEKERRRIEQFELKIIQECDVICTTCNDAGSEKLMNSLRAQFCTVIVDECCQVTDADLLIPLVKNCQQLVLFGDPNGEIKPFLRSNVAQEARYDLSLMERLMLNGLKPSFLKAQHRMHPDLTEYPSKKFYGGFLENDKNITISNFVNIPIERPNNGFPMFFWNVKSGDDQKLNHISELIEKLLNHGIQAKEIGLISPCIGQIELLIEKLQKISDIEIGTIDDFQGKEKNFIILSLLSDDSDNAILNSKNNFCVALTRARFGLIIVGCAGTFLENAMWSDFVNFCKEKNAIVEGSLDSLKVSEIL